MAGLSPYSQTPCHIPAAHWELQKCKAFCMMRGSSYYVRMSSAVLLGNKFLIQTVHLLPIHSSVPVLTWKPEVEKSQPSLSNSPQSGRIKKYVTDDLSWSSQYFQNSSVPPLVGLMVCCVVLLTQRVKLKKTKPNQTTKEHWRIIPNPLFLHKKKYKNLIKPFQTSSSERNSMVYLQLIFSLRNHLVNEMCVWVVWESRREKR